MALFIFLLLAMSACAFLFGYHCCAIKLTVRHLKTIRELRETSFSLIDRYEKHILVLEKMMKGLLNGPNEKFIKDISSDLGIDHETSGCENKNITSPT